MFFRILYKRSIMQVGKNWPRKVAHVKIPTNVRANRIEQLSVASTAGWQPNSLIESTAGSDTRHWQIATPSPLRPHQSAAFWTPLFFSPAPHSPKILQCSTLLGHCISWASIIVESPNSNPKTNILLSIIVPHICNSNPRTEKHLIICPCLTFCSKYRFINLNNANISSALLFLLRQCIGQLINVFFKHYIVWKYKI